MTKVLTGGDPAAPIAPLSSGAMPGSLPWAVIELGMHSTVGKPVPELPRKPPGRPSVTSTMATRCVGIAAMRWRANMSAPASAGPVGVYPAGLWPVSDVFSIAAWPPLVPSSVPIATSGIA